MRAEDDMEPNAKGFTLIEVMIVIAIIGILAAIALPQYFRYIQTAKAQAVAANFKMAVDAVAAAYAATNDGVTSNVYTTLNGQSAIDRADPVFGRGTPAFLVTGGTPICGQVAITSSVISPAGPASVTLTAGASGCGGESLGSDIAAALSAEQFPDATGNGVVVYQNGRV